MMSMRHVSLKISAVVLVACLVFALCALPGPWRGTREAQAAPSDVPNPQFWGTNGYVDEIVSDGDTVYIGGNFSYVGPNTGSGATLNASSGDLLGDCPVVVSVVRTAISDGSGGWYVGGDFTMVDGITVNHLAHIRADGTLDTTFNPNVNNNVYALLLSGTTLYVGGSFSSIQGASGGPYGRSSLAAIDVEPASPGYSNPTAWDPGVTGSVASLLLSGATLYVGGNFSTIQGSSGGPYTRYHLAAVDTLTGNPTTWNPGMNGTVYGLALYGPTLYAGGNFTTIQGGTGGPYARNHLAAIDTVNANPTAWNPDVNQGLYDIALAGDGSTLYVGGDFTTIQGGTGGPYARNRLAAIDTVNANPTAWNPGLDGGVHSLLLSGSTLYAGGYFENVQGSSGGPYPRRCLAAIDTAGGNPTGFVANADYTVEALALSGTTLYAGGSFSSIGGVPRTFLAALDASTGRATDFDPNPNFNVYDMVLYGTTLYIGGMFTSVRGRAGGPYPRNRIAGIETDPASPAYANPIAFNPDVNDDVYALAVSADGLTLYAGGDFISIQGASGGPYVRYGFAAIDVSSSNPTTWRPYADGTVRTFALSDNGSTLFTGGDFRNIQGTGGSTVARNFLAAIGTANGEPTAWDPNLNSVVYDLELNGTGLLYVGGYFTTIQGSSGGPYTRSSLAAIDTSTANPTSFNPGADVSVHKVGLNGSTLYAGGGFTTIQGSSGGPYTRNHLAAIDTATGNPTAWNPNVNSTLISLLSSGSTIYAGGNFDMVGNVLCKTFAAFDGQPSVDSITPSTGENDGTVSITDLAGAGFRAGASVLLRKTGETDIAADNVTVASASQITCDFDLDHAAVGDWDVVVVNPDAQEGTLADGFTVNQATRTIAASAGANGSITPAGNVVVDYGEDQAFTITPDTGYQVDDVQVDGVSVGAVTGYAFYDVTSDHAIEASFAPYSTWYLAEGCTEGGMETWVLVQNPRASAVNVDLILQTSSGEQRPAGLQGQVIPAGSRRSFNLGAYWADWNISTKVEADSGVICERAMYGGERTWAHDSIGVTAPAATWFLAEGCTGPGFETWVLVQNPNASAVNVDFTLMTSSGAMDGPQNYPIAANSRQSFRLNDYVTDWNVSTKVDSWGGGVICERAMYGNGRTWAHDCVGVTQPAADWYLAEGCTGPGFETWVLVQNPYPTQVAVDLTFMTSAGPVAGPQGFAIPANSRHSFRVNDYVTDYDVSTTVSSTSTEIICERAVYGNGRVWAHDSIGATGAQTVWYLAEGCTEGGMETWVLVQNPGGAAVTVDLVLQTSTGEQRPAGLQDQVIPAGSRRSFNLGEYWADWNVSTKVEADGGVICERAMYGGERTWAHDSVGFAP